MPAALPRGRVRMATLLHASLFFMLIGQLGRIPAFSTGQREAPILFNDLFVGVVLVAGLLVLAMARETKLDGVAMAGLGFAAIGGISALLSVPRFNLSGFEIAVSLAYLARWLFYFGLYVVAINVLRRRDVPAMWRSLELAVLLFAAFGILQSAFLPGFAQIVYPDSRPFIDWDPQARRLVSTVLDPNFAGAIILLGLLVEVAQLAQGTRIPMWKPITLMAALLLTASRSSILALLVGGLVILAVRGLGKTLLKFAGVLLVLVAAALPQLLEFARGFDKLGIDDPSALARVVVWLRGITVFADHPIIGVGFNTWGFVGERYGWERFGVASYGIEGGLLFVAVMSGIVGLTVFLSMLGFLLLRCRRVWRAPDATAEERAIAVGAAAFTVALLAHSTFTNSLFFPFILQPLFILWALTFAMAQRDA